MLGFCKIFVYFYLVIVYDGGDDGGDDDVIYGDYGDVIFYDGDDVCDDDICILIKELMLYLFLLCEICIWKLILLKIFW